MQHLFRLVFVASLFGTGCATSLPDDVEAALTMLPSEIDFNRDVRPILSDRCYSCHGPDNEKREADLRFDLGRDHIVETNGRKLLDQYLLDRILESDSALVMPPPESNLTLTAPEKAILTKWTRQGSEFQPHWAWSAPVRPEVPVAGDGWAKNPIDRFIARRLQDLDLTPKEPAQSEVLLRRLAFDLTGLPPSDDVLQSLPENADDSYYLPVIGRLMESQHYGERMAVDWLDVARYADTHGYSIDRYRDMSHWRDWVINAFNDHMPYDQFTIEQLAGDMLPGASREQILATGFNRNHQQNMEGGIVPEEFRVEYATDRANTFGTAFLGLGLGCARCHDHKYDPVEQEEYFQLVSYFDNINEAGQISYDNAMPVPTMVISNERVDSIIDVLDDQIENTIQELEVLRSRAKLDQLPKLEVTSLLKNGLVSHFTFDDQRKADRLDRQRKALAYNSTGADTMVYTDGFLGQAPIFNGDTWLDLSPAGVFDRHQPFTVSLRAWFPKDLSDGTIFHKGQGAILYNFRGYHLALRDDGLEIVVARTLPDNALVCFSSEAVPREEWIHLAMSYDGSSDANGVSLYVNGAEVKLREEHNNLFKSILLSGKKQPGLQLGARWRGQGIPGGILDEVMVHNRVLESSTVELLASDPANHFVTQPVSLLPEYQRIERQLAQLRKIRNHTVDSLPETMIMKEMETPRPTFVLDRGQYDAPLQQVKAGVPARIQPSDARHPADRLELAQWLFRDDHPLTARVYVNRLWQSFFGHGLVETSEDFGSQGSMPTHPELLDWLAVEFIESGWDIQHMQKLVLTSATYQQSSRSEEADARLDPDNRYYSRGPARRLSAEMLRDNALAVSQLLSRKVGGPSVFPYQPDGLWKVNSTTYPTSTGEDLYRRSLYTVWKRSVPHPTLHIFDAPERSECMPRRQQTQTPLQSLVLLNDPVYVEASCYLGDWICNFDDVEQGIMAAYQRSTTRWPTPDERKLLKDLYDQEIKRFTDQPNKMEGWLLANPDHPDKKALAASAVVASTIINCDATSYLR